MMDYIGFYLIAKGMEGGPVRTECTQNMSNYPSCNPFGDMSTVQIPFTDIQISITMIVILTALFFLMGYVYLTWKEKAYGNK